MLNIKHIDGLLSKSQRKKVDQWFSGAGGSGEWGVTANDVSFCNDANYVKLEIIVTQLYEYTKCTFKR